MKTILLKKEHILSLIILIFCSSGINAQSNSNDTAATMQSFKLEFNNVNGPSVNRILQLSFSDDTSDSYDEGYDTKNLELMQDDLNLILSGEYYTSQAYSSITEDKIVDLVFQASGSYSYTIELTDMENLGSQNVELRDNLLDTSFNLRGGDAYTFSSDAGNFPGRFQLTFKTTVLSNNDLDIENVDIRYANATNTIVVTNPKNKEVKNIEVYSVAGQRVYNNNILKSESSIRYQTGNLNTGIYIIRLETENNGILTKKIVAI